MADNQFEYQAFPGYVKRSKSASRFFWAAAVFVILIALIIAGLYLLGSSQKVPVKKTAAPTAVVTITSLPTSSVSAVLSPGLTGQITPGTSRNPASPSLGISKVDRSTNLDRSNLSLAVLNGSGEAGAAKGVSTYLESLGYKIARVGNADVFTYRNFSVIVKRSKSGFAGLLKKDLQANPAFASVSASISDDISGDAEVIVGK